MKAEFFLLHWFQLKTEEIKVALFVLLRYRSLLTTGFILKNAIIIMLKLVSKCLIFLSQDVSAVHSKYVVGSSNPVDIEESFSSHKTTSPYVSTQSGKALRSSSNDEVAIASGLAACTCKCEINVSENLLHKHNAAHPKLHAPGVEYDVSATDIALKVNVSDTGVYCSYLSRYMVTYLDSISIVIFYMNIILLI